VILVDGKGHLVSTASEEELHAFARSIGLRRSWFQDGGGPYRSRIPHYDITTSRK
jgi:hypothetical protein